MHASHGKLDRYDVLLAVCVRLQPAVVKLKKKKGLKKMKGIFALLFPKPTKSKREVFFFLYASMATNL